MWGGGREGGAVNPRDSRKPPHTHLLDIGSLPADDELHGLLGHSHLHLDVVLPDERQPLFCTDHARPVRLTTPNATTSPPLTELSDTAIQEVTEGLSHKDREKSHLSGHWKAPKERKMGPLSGTLFQMHEWRKHLALLGSGKLLLEKRLTVSEEQARNPRLYTRHFSSPAAGETEPQLAFS